MGLFNVGCRVENHKDAKKSAEISMIMVDTGSMHTWIAEGTLRELGIEPVKQVEFETATGEIVTRPVGFAVLRSDEFETADEVVFAQEGDSQYLGWRALSGMNARVDEKSNRLVDAGPVVAARAFSLTPRLEPGVKAYREGQNRFNGFPCGAKTVETAEDFSLWPVHRAEATVLMRAGS